MVLVLIAGILPACAQPYDRSRVDSSRAELREPYQRIDGTYFTDRGSVGISLTDRDGRHQFFFVSARIEEPNPYSRVFVGRIPDDKSSTVPEARDPEPTKRRLADILRSKKNRTREEDLCIAALTGSTIYSLRAVVRNLAGDE